jgi:hypothetical protein
LSSCSSEYITLAVYVSALSLSLFMSMIFINSMSVDWPAYFLLVLTAYPPAQLPNCPPFLLPSCQHANMPTRQHANMPTRQYTHMPTLPTCQLANLPTHQLVNLPAYLPTSLPACLSLCSLFCLLVRLLSNQLSSKSLEIFNSINDKKFYQIVGGAKFANMANKSFHSFQKFFAKTMDDPINPFLSLTLFRVSKSVLPNITYLSHSNKVTRGRISCVAYKRPQ